MVLTAARMAAVSFRFRNADGRTSRLLRYSVAAFACVLGAASSASRKVWSTAVDGTRLTDVGTRLELRQRPSTTSVGAARSWSGSMPGSGAWKSVTARPALGPRPAGSSPAASGSVPARARVGPTLAGSPARRTSAASASTSAACLAAPKSSTTLSVWTAAIQPSRLPLPFARAEASRWRISSIVPTAPVRASEWGRPVVGQRVVSPQLMTTKQG